MYLCDHKSPSVVACSWVMTRELMRELAKSDSFLAENARKWLEQNAHRFTNGS